MIQEQERRSRAESAAQAAMNGPRVEAFKYAGPDFEVSAGHALLISTLKTLVYITTGICSISIR